jgi:hypothetical protein
MGKGRGEIRNPKIENPGGGGRDAKNGKNDPTSEAGGAANFSDFELRISN